MKIKVEPFLMKKGNRVAKAAIEFDSTDTILDGFQLVGFTVCDDAERGLFVLFPASMTKTKAGESKPFFFLRPFNEDSLARLEEQILDVYDNMTGNHSIREAL